MVLVIRRDRRDGDWGFRWLGSTWHGQEGFATEKAATDAGREDIESRGFVVSEVVWG